MLAFTFPGQGSQRPGMGRPWVDHPSWELVAEASDLSGRDVAGLLLEADAGELTATAEAQLATFVLSLVVLDAVERVGLAPTLCAGHSLGEYSALVAAGVIGFEDGVRLVTERGAAMAEAAEERRGTMAAVLGADDDAVEAACGRAEGDVWVANYNAPGQVVIAGDPGAVEAAGTVAKELGARKVMPMAVAGAFHTSFMAPARARLRKALAETRFHDSEVPVVANVDATVHPDASSWGALLSAQLCSPVRWRQCLATLDHLGATTLAEVGPGGVLTGLARRAVPGATALALATPADLDALVQQQAGGGWVEAYVADHAGEHLFASERLVLSPTAGVFEPALGAPAPGGAAPPGRRPEVPGADDGVAVGVGELVGRVGDAEVRTPFPGRLVGYLAHRGERVAMGQPVAWMRAGGGPT